MNEMQALVDALASELGRPVEVDDQRFRAIVYSAHGDADIDHVRLQSILQREAPKAATEWLASLGVHEADPFLRIPANAALAMAPRLCVPLRFNGSLLGYLWIVESPDALDEEQVEIGVRYAAELAAELFRVRRLEGIGRYQESEVVRGLTLGDEDVEAAAAAWRQSSLASASLYSCLLVAATNPLEDARLVVQVAAALEATRRTVAPHHIASALDGDRGIAVIAHEDPSEPLRRARHLQAWLAGQCGEARAVVGVSAARNDPAGLRAAFREAEAAAELALAGVSDPVCAADEIGAYRLILALRDGARGPTLWDEPLGSLAEAADGAALIETLETYLDHAGDVRATADALFLHRSSLYNRVHRIESLTGRDLRSGDARLELHLALRAWRLAGAPPIRQLSSRAAQMRDT